MACDWVGTQLARWFKLSTFDFAILSVTPDDEIPLGHGCHAEPGPAFVTRAERGHPWGGSARELEQIDNPYELGPLVVFDTWTLNCDRHSPDPATRKPNYDNVFLSEERAAPGHFRLITMDHTHCFTCGRELNERVARIDRTKDDRVYGLFPGFVGHLDGRQTDVRDAVARLRTFERRTCEAVVNSIPPEWEVSKEARKALCELICQRAGFVADNIIDWLSPKCWPQGRFDFDANGDNP
ncbi:MAG: hypothetical protein JXA69_05505 [Phycisphaerae bacterium]|nr:hypothetical protein [Phycisphaerae bacterium]